MSTTLSVLHVLMAGPGRDVNLPAHDVIQGAGGLPGLDPLLQDFWSAFPCPPPWNHALLFRVNWTACVGQAVGERLKWFLADRCHIPHDGTRLLPVPGGEEGAEGEMEAPDVYALVPRPRAVIERSAVKRRCLAGAITHGDARRRRGVRQDKHGCYRHVWLERQGLPAPCTCAAHILDSRQLHHEVCYGSLTTRRVVWRGMLTSGCHLQYDEDLGDVRKRPKNSSPTHNSALNAHPDNAKYYTSCHYASAPVMSRPSETTLCGNRTETRLLNGTCSHQLSPYHQQHEHHPLVTPQHVPHCSHAHTHLTPLLVNVNGQTTVLRQGEVPTLAPAGRGMLSYRRLEGGGGGGDYTSSSAASQTNSDRSHTYESIGDGHFPDVLKNGVVVGGGGGMVGGCGGGGGVGMGLVSPPFPDPRRTTPDFCDCDCGAAAAAAAAAHLDLDPAGMLTLDGYYNDRCTQTQTLPVRHFRHVIRETGAVAGGEPPNFGGPYSFDIEDSPHNGPRPDSRLSNRSRRRTSSGSHYSDRSLGGGYREGQKRNIPALHPNYFDPPEPAAPDTFTS
ncbi:uncharacterized protein LOC143281421 [Babylonia areolata]|uniref:uncharacterized protein LOC143281421 n=1 Tax=Babylonia areolata TaxID=304850 RepID=UPI003FD0C003